MKVVAADELDKNVVEELRRISQLFYMPQDLAMELADAEVLIVRSSTKVTKELLGKAGKLKIVARAGVGLDNVDVKECEKRGITVINTPDASTISVAELAIGLMICLLRKTVKADRYVRSGTWKRKELVGHEIYGKTLGVIGLGRIGSVVAQKANALGMNVLASSPRAASTQYVKAVPPDELLSKSDVVTIHVTLTPETRGMVNRGLISKMKDGAYLLNLARGEVVDEEALYEALKSGKLAGAALDVTVKEPYEGKLLELDNVIFSSHTGANTHEAQERVGKELLSKLKGYL